jgi:hypothetical protein
MTANKRVSILQSPLRSPLRSPEGSMSGSDASSGSSNGDCPLVGEDSSDDSSQYSTGSSNTDGGSVPPSQASRSVARGGLRYASLAGGGKHMNQGCTRSDYSAIPNSYRGGSFSSESSEDEEMLGMGDAAPTGGQGMGTEHATLPHSHCHRLLTSLPPWTGPEDFSLLSQYVRTHFSGDWAAFRTLDRLPTAGVSRQTSPR